MIKIRPEILFTITKEPALNFDLKRFTPPLRISHQNADPMRTPRTIRVADNILAFVTPKPSPANTAAKERMVVGFVMVRKRVEK